MSDEFSVIGHKTCRENTPPLVLRYLNSTINLKAFELFDTCITAGTTATLGFFSEGQLEVSMWFQIQQRARQSPISCEQIVYIFLAPMERC